MTDKTISKKSLLWVGIMFKSLFKATTELVWGMVSFIAFGIGMLYLKEKNYLSEFAFVNLQEPLLSIYNFITANLALFWIVFFLLYLYSYYLDYLKETTK